MIKFVTGLAPRIGELVVFGRHDPKPGRAPYALPGENVTHVPFPYYPSVFAVGRMVRAFPGARAAFLRELPRLDAVLLFGPHPFAVGLALAARRRGKPVILGVRQDYPSYIGKRLPGPRWAWAGAAAHALERAFRLLSRRSLTLVVGQELERKYARGGGRVHRVSFSLVSATDVVPSEEALERRWDGTRRLLSVGRLDPEKNPLLLPEIVAGLRQRDEAWQLAVAGEGPLAQAVLLRSEELGVAGSIDLLGYVPHGPRLAEEYARSHALLHVSLTEGIPQVLFEAQAAGLPVVATDVGGVRAAVGESALLVPPDDAEAAVGALRRLGEDEALRRALVERGLANAAGTTMEAELDRIAELILADQASTSTAEISRS